MTTPRIVAGLVLALAVTGIVAAPADAADVPAVDPNCNATVSTPTLFDQDTLADPVPMTVNAPFECGSAFDANAWSFTWRSASGDAIAWSPGRYIEVRATTFTVPVTVLYPGTWTLTSNVAWIRVTSSPITVLGTVHNTASVSRAGSGPGFTVTGTVDRLAKGGRVPYTGPILLSQRSPSAGFVNRATIAADSTGHYAYTGTSNDALTLQTSTARNLQSPYVEFATSNTVTLAAAANPTPPPVVTPPPTDPAPPVVTNPAPPVVTNPAPPTTPAPPTAPVVKAKHRTFLSVSSVHRSGKHLSMKATLIDTDRARNLSAVVLVQRWTSHGWKTVAVETTGRFSIKAGTALYRLAYAGSRSYTTSVSKAFLR